MNLATLMNVAPALEEGWRGLFTANDIAAITRQNAPENFQTVTPRVEIRCKMGAATGHRYIAYPGVYYNDTWFVDFAIRCVTRPQNIETDNLLYDDFVSTVRGMAQTFGQATWVDSVDFPYHLIVEPLRDTTTDDNLKADENEEFAMLNFSGIAQIRTNAWTDGPPPPTPPVPPFNVVNGQLVPVGNSGVIKIWDAGLQMFVHVRTQNGQLQVTA